MAVKSLKLGSTVVTNSARVSLRPRFSKVEDAPGGVYPIRLAAFHMDPYRVGMGWPQTVPECDIHTNVLVSCEGDVLADRLIPAEVDTNAFTRWYPDEETFSDIDLRWDAGQGHSMMWEAFPGTEPTLLSDYEYRVGNEVFLRDVLSFDSDSGDYLEGNLNELGGSAGYSVILVASITSVNPEYSGLWCPTSKTDGWVSVEFQGTSLFVETEQTPRHEILQVNNLLDTSAPLMLAMCFGRPWTTFYAAAGPSDIISGRVQTGRTPTSFNSSIYLGRSTEDLDHGTDMALLDVGLYPDKLSGLMVRDEFATLSGLYGGDR